MKNHFPLSAHRLSRDLKVAPLAVLLGLGLMPRAAQAIPAFPGAEGFGANATGGRGGTVYHVTNLNDSGAGSFRDAVSATNRIIVFDVGGMIRLRSDLSISKDITIAAQTAPGQGISIYGGIEDSRAGQTYAGGRISWTGANRIIVRGLRYRHGAYASSRQSDAWSIGSGSNMIFDHCSVLWGTDEVFSINGTASNITVQNTIIGQGLETHSAGGLVQTVDGGGVSLLRNLYIDNNTRNVKANGTNQFVNNIVYNWGGTGGDGFIQGDTSADSYVNAQGNYFINGYHTASSKNAFVRGTASFHLYASGNYQDRNKDGVLNGALLTQDDYGTGERAVDFLPTPHAFPAVTTLSAQEAYNFVQSNVGAAVLGAGGAKSRDELDDWLITEMSSLGTLGASITHEFARPVANEFDEPMTNKFIVPNASRPAGYDTDGDAMPDAWERTYGLNPTSAADGNGDFDKTGYSNVEKYLNSIYDGTYPIAAFPSPWRHSDVGAVGVAGTSRFHSGIFTVNGGGADLAGTADEFRFVSQPISGDATITARLVTFQNTAVQAKAGVMIRESLDAGSKYAAMIVRPLSRGSLALRRTTTNASGTLTAGGGIGEPYWLRVKRVGNSLICSQSADGIRWTDINTSTITMGATVHVGMVVSSVDDTRLNTSTFDNVSVAGTPMLQTGASPALISEFRLGGPNGDLDEYVEIYNNTDAPLDLAGWNVVGGSGVGTLMGTIPGGKIIPARGHLLFTGANYSLPEAGDSPLSGDLPTGTGISLRDASNAVFDSVGLVGSSFVEGAGLPAPLAGAGSQHAYVRRADGGLSHNTGDNSTEFRLVEVTNTGGNGGAHGGANLLRLGAPGPENLGSPILRNRQIGYAVVDASNAANNQLRLTAPAGSNAQFGTLALRRTISNNTGSAVTKMRIRVTQITAGTPSGSSTADLRILSSSGTVISKNGASVAVAKMTLENESAQPHGGALNSSLIVDFSGLPGGALASGDSINVEWLFGVAAKGTYLVAFNMELK